MSGTTTVEGFPYPLESDFADVQDAFRLATSIDSDLRFEQAPFRAFEGRLSFIARLLTSASTFTNGSQSMVFSAIDWDNTGGLVLGATSWQQPPSQPPSWWMFGATLLVNNPVSGVVGDMTMADITVHSSDQVSNVVSQADYYQRNDETNTGGEWLNLFTMAAIYQGTASLSLIINGSTAKSISAGSRLWGMYLGPVV